MRGVELIRNAGVPLWTHQKVETTTRLELDRWVLAR
jgi:hypothetical protein